MSMMKINTSKQCFVFFLKKLMRSGLRRKEEQGHPKSTDRRQ